MNFEIQMNDLPTIKTRISEFPSYSLCSFMGSAPMGVLEESPAPSCILVAAVGEHAYVFIVPKGLMEACENSSSQRRGLREEQIPAENRNTSGFHG